ncbi:MAG: hypothetical protein ACLFOY_04590 [Desulfatibacillaceae bacterium]
MSPETTVLFFNLILYVLIVFAFNKARNRYAGGKVGDMINLVLLTVILLFLSDYIRLLDPYIADTIVFTVRHLLRTAALAVLAFGGIRIGAG